jgi:hypothetical protein
VQFLGENLAPPAPQPTIDLVEDNEQGDENEDEVNNDGAGFEAGGVSDPEDDGGDTQQATAGSAAGDQDDQSVESNVAVRVRRRRRKKASKRTVVDFENRAYEVQDGVLHINPNVLKQAREDTKICSELTAPVKGEVENGNVREGKGRTNLRSPRTAGISRAALATLGMPAPKIKEGEHLVTDAVVMHIVGVVLAQQYSVNKGI